ncbi:MAG TPA: lysozyme [Caulobacteraceae bacterium]|jgi:GH24 family phage-related lysozyme (muramidase)
MKPRQRLSRAGLKLLKSFEGFRQKSARLPGRGYVVGYGHTRSAREGVQVTPGEAEALLLYDLMPVEAAVNEWVFAPLSQNQFDALVSFAFSIGVKAFRRSNVLRFVNQGAMLQAAGALEMWRQADIEGEVVVVDALVRRRAAEKALFLMPVEGWPHSPSAILKPRLDASAFLAVPRARVEAVDTPMDGDTARAVRMAAEGVLEDEPDVTDEEADDYSTARAAASAVTARLQQLLSAGQEPAAAAEEAPETLPEIDPFPADDRVVDIRSAVDRSTLGPFTPETGGVEAADPQAQLPQEPRNSGPYLLLGLLGVVFWIMALVAVFRTPGDGAVGEGVADVGWILGLGGTACVLGALWFLLGREEVAPEEPSTEDRREG